MLHNGFAMFAYATGGMLTVIVGSVEEVQHDCSVLQLDHTLQSIETTLIVEVEGVGCHGCCLYPPLPHSGSVMFEFAISGTLMEMGGSVVGVWGENSVLVQTTGQRTIETTQIAEVEAAKWLGN
jgi:hypothetical protein